MDIVDLLQKSLGLLLIPVAIAAWWTGFRLLKGDDATFAQIKATFPRSVDILLGRVNEHPESRPDEPTSDGVVSVRRRGKTIWILNRKMSDEQYDRLTR